MYKKALLGVEQMGRAGRNNDKKHGELMEPFPVPLENSG
jgi:hypothetical protein